MTFCIADPYLVGNTPARRFLCGISVQLGHPFYITPTVATESVRTIRRTEELHWWDRMKENDLPTRVQDDVFVAVGDEVEAWGKELLNTDSGWLGQVSTSTKHNMEAIRFSLEAPSEAFLDPRAMNDAQDKAIIGEAIVGGADVVITRNTSTIDHAMLNRWLISSGLRSAPVLHTPDNGISEILGGFKAEYAHLAAITMGLARPPGSEWEEHRSLMRFARDLDSSLPHFAAVIRHEELRNDDTPERWRRARANLLETKWQEVKRRENDRIARTQAAAQEAGFEIEI